MASTLPGEMGFRLVIAGFPRERLEPDEGGLFLWEGL